MLFISLSSLGTPLVRLLPWKESISGVFLNLSNRCYEFFKTVTYVLLWLISMDRWISVQFPVKYRGSISRLKIRKAIVLSWLITSVLALPGMIFYWPILLAACDRPIRNIYVAHRDVWAFFNGPLLLKVKQLLTKARVSSGPPAVSGVIIAGIVWTSLRASMVVLTLALITDLPFLMHAERWIANPSLVRFIYMLPSMQKMTTPLVNLIFFPPFRAIVRKGGRRRFRCNIIARRARVIPAVARNAMPAI
ncbi:hypothetical protein BV898_02793 [Hypsibius exemplaris]|uniref:G-protein coupled receptors family 1 profile domain-containing protein n=1 Tax=Hypsibius exemplaris TaxID=2072580 RepID=A0A1W0X715_HYPEX|nr:hypothetical protein BV898_02793 [Hypsibius exemplaris]